MSTFDFTSKRTNAEIIGELESQLLALQAIESNTDPLEGQLNSLITLVSSLDSKDYATVATLLVVKSTLELIKTNSDKFQFETNGDLKVTQAEALSLNTDAAGRLRISELNTIIDLKQIADDLPLFYDTVLLGTGTSTHSVSNAGSLMSVTNDGDAVIRQTKMRFNYQTGKSFLCFNTFDRFQPQTDVVKRVGYFNSSPSPIPQPLYDGFKDGIYLESSNGTVYTVVIKDGVATSKTAQADWNLDKLDGTGPSGVTMDWSKGQVYVFDMLWLGKAGVRHYMEIGDQLIMFHKDEFANILQDVYISNPNHSIRYEIRSTGGAGEMFQVCSTVATEGSRNETGVIRGHNVGTQKLDANTAGIVYAAMGIRLKTTHKFAEIDLLVFSLLATTSDNYIWELRSNPTVAGTFTYVDEINSALQIAIGASTNTVTGGEVIDNGYVFGKTSERSTIDNALKLGSFIDGRVDEFVLCITPLSNGLDVFTSMTNRETL